jgi:RNA polymerase sigma factor (TIGR02999 family)
LSDDPAKGSSRQFSSEDDAVLAAVYDQLRAIARRRLAGEAAGHTLQATALVHEAYVKLSGNPSIFQLEKARFMFAAAEAMRRILIDHARTRKRAKRGGPAVRRQPLLDVADLAGDVDPDQTLALDEAIRRLQEQDAQAARVVELRFFAGLSVEETAEVLGVSPRTVKRDWAFARAWLYEALS